MTIQPLFPLWTILTGFVLLLTILSWLEIRRAAGRLVLRLTALVLVLSAIAGLVIQPVWERVEKEAGLILLTSEFDAQTVDSVLQVYPDWEVIRMPDAARFPGSKPVEDYLELSALGHRIGAIAGAGVPPYALEYIPKKHFQYFPSPPAVGFTDLLTPVYQEGQTNQLRGKFYLQEGPLSLLLKSPGGIVDSTVLKEPGMQAFSLPFRPKSSGQWDYAVTVKDSSGHILNEEQLPLVVAAKKQLRILFLQAFPTFEIRYLKDFLADRGHAVAVRTQISRDKFRTELVNLPMGDLGRLNSALLAQFDLVVGDGAAYDLLGRNESGALSTAVENGLGFLGLPDGERRAYRQWLGLAGIASQADTVHLTAGASLPAYAVRPGASYEWYTVQRSRTERPVAAYRYREKGKIGFQSIVETYTYLLRGDSMRYAELWMPVLEAVQRESYSTHSISLLTDFPIYVGEPVDFRVIAGQAPETVFANDAEVPLLEDYTLEGVWYGRMWPERAGWHRLVSGERALQFYAFPPGKWSDLKIAKNQMQMAAASSAEPSPVVSEQTKTLLEPVSRLWFYLVFLLGGGLLWLAPKL